ncbi:MAG TPA: hypothetical protein VII25_03080, partial [Candidatus Acidoferrum sp.]
PAAIILSGSAVLLWAAFTKRWRNAFRCLHPAAIASFCLTALPWYILCSHRNPDFFRVFIIEHNFKRFFTPEFQHIQPFWYYLPIVLIAFLPWSPALLFSTFAGCRRVVRDQHLSPSTLFLLCWAVFCLLFFSVSKSKLPGYILPAIPAIGLLLANSYVRLTARESLIFRWVQNITGILLVVLCLVLMQISHVKSVTNPKIAMAEGWIALAFGLANFLLGIKRPRTFVSCRVNPFCVVPLFFLLCFFDRLSSNFFRMDPSGQTLAKEIIERRIPLDQLYVANMRRGQQYSLNFYLHHETQQWNPNENGVGFVLIEYAKCWGEVEPPPIACADSAAQQTPSGWFVYQLKRQE